MPRRHHEIIPEFGKPIEHQVAGGRTSIQHQQHLTGVHSYYEMRGGQRVLIQSHNRQREGDHASSMFTLLRNNLHHTNPHRDGYHIQRRKNNNYILRNDDNHVHEHARQHPHEQEDDDHVDFDMNDLGEVLGEHRILEGDDDNFPPFNPTD